MHTFIHRLSRIMALIGGGVLLLLVLLTCLSVIGRSINTIGHYDFVQENLGFLSAILIKFSPINGDYEIVEAGIAFAILAFFPWCMVNRGHATVDIFTAFLPVTGNRFLAFVWEVIFVVALVVISWRLYVGTTDKMRYGETTFLLETPVWWGYAACFAASLVAALVAVYSMYMRGRELLHKNEPVQSSGSADH